jgi:hypothetical protein
VDASVADFDQTLKVNLHQERSHDKSKDGQNMEIS